MDTSRSAGIDPLERSLVRRLDRPGIIAATVILAVLVNLAIYLIGAAAGADYSFTAGGRQIQVDALTLIGFSLVPLLIGMIVAAVLARRWAWVIPTALIVAPLLEVGTIFVLLLPAGFAAPSTIALAGCHVALAVVTVLGLLALRNLGRLR